VSHSSVSRVFGKRSKQHTLILASGDNIRHWTIRPWVVGLTASFIAVMAIGYLLATTYLILRDDLVGSAMARQARMQHAYEDRIASLRSQVDRITSRQLLDQQQMDNKVTELMEQQAKISTRHGRIDLLLNKADIAVVSPVRIPVPKTRPETADAGNRQASLETAPTHKENRFASREMPLRISHLAYADAGNSATQNAGKLFDDVFFSLKTIEHEQFKKVQHLTSNTYQAVETIHSILRKSGIKTQEESGIGGPFVTAENPAVFDTSLKDLGTALDKLEKAKKLARKIPIANPAPHQPISSRFGTRRDPFLDRVAHHSGIDFRVAYGQAVFATGTGTVLSAGRKGGYGKMIEIDHGNGITTRFAHLSRMLVKVGDRVTVGQKIAAAGSTGRSTGPHLHYEIRVHDKAVNPQRFLAAGEKLTPLL
tara:strand:- start:3091 stop:4362 length:1272 start_codon:yes stop_codon:yes gene_type:complete